MYISIDVNYWVDTKLQPEDWQLSASQMQNTRAEQEETRKWFRKRAVTYVTAGGYCLPTPVLPSCPCPRIIQSQVWRPRPGCWGMSRGNARAISGHHGLLLPGPEHLRSQEMPDEGLRVEWLISNVSKKCDGRSVTGSRARVSLPGLLLNYPGSYGAQIMNIA